MRWKKGISFLMAALLLASSFMTADAESVSAGGMAYAVDSKAAGGQKNRYFYGQLAPEAKKLYDAMYEMYKAGTFQTGTEDYDLAAHGRVSKERMEAYAAGDTGLLQLMGAARDAFYADYADLFYVDVSYLSLRVTRDKGNNYHAYLGTGRSDNYFLEGFKSRQEVESAVEEYEKKVAEIVSGAKKLKAETGKSLAKEQVRYVHDYIINHTSYRLEHQCSPGNAGHVRTAYGALVKGESVCEGYARAVKAVLDRLGIPCILVQGSYRASEEDYELHMWNYVQIDGKWYAVDATMDDPISKKRNTGGRDGYENTEYFLVGEDVMSRRHVPSGIMSEAEYEFSYPSLEYIGETYELLSASMNGLVVKYNENGELEGEKAGEYRISYKNMGYAKAAKEAGIYMLARFPSFDEKTGELKSRGEWGYITPEIYQEDGIKDSDEELLMLMPQVPFVEFAVTNVAPGNYLEDVSKLYYQGDPLLLEAESGILYNPSGTYKAPPYIKRQTPAATGRITSGAKQHVTVTYDDKLILKDAKEIGYRLESTGGNGDTVKNTKIENFTWDGESTVEFDFTPSNMWADDCVNYIIYLTGVVGVTSGKTPNPISYYASFPCAVCAYRSRGYYWNLFGKPSLLENDDLSTADWKTRDGSAVTQDMVKNLVLVASSVANGQADDMNEMVSGELSSGQKVLKSETYNINLTTCRQQIVQTGESVRVSLGFPDGYGPNDAGVTFKAYHFTKNSAGEITGVSEIPCIITPYGLVILCDSFSPFAIVAVEDSQAKADPVKNVLLSNTQGGAVRGAGNGLLSLKKGQRKTFTVSADKGYEIDELTVGGANAKITDRNTMKVTVKYEDLSDGCSIVDVKFAAKTVLDKERARGETLVQPKAAAAKIRLSAKSLNVKEKEDFTIRAKVTEHPGVHVYQWYKDGVPLPGKKGSSLTVKGAAKKDAGEYTLEVTTTAGASTATARSSACKVSVSDGGKGGSSGTASALKAVTGVKAVSSATNSVKLTWKKVSNADGYYVYRYNEKKKKFVRLADVQKTAYTDKGCVSGQGYRYRVRSYRTVRKKKVAGKLSGIVKVIVMPKAPSSLSGKRVSDTVAELSFKKVSRATEYRVYQSAGTKSGFSLAYRVKGKKIYKYQKKSKKWIYFSKIKQTRNGKIVCRLTGLNRNKAVRYRVITMVSKSGYKTASSQKSRVVTVRP